MDPSGTRRFEAVIFDLDGVLVDSEIWWDEARADFARAHGRPWTEDDRAAVMGQNSRQWSTTMRARLRIESDEDEIQRTVVEAVVDRYRRDGAPLIAGAADVVRRVHRDLRTAVASSAHRDVIDAALDALELRDAFDVVVSSDEVAHGKPEPDVYLETAHRLGVAPARCLVVEDSRNGVLAGISAGMAVALVPNASIPPAPGARESASIVLPRLSGILDMIGLSPDSGLPIRRAPGPDGAAIGAAAEPAMTDREAGVGRRARVDDATTGATEGRPDLPGPPIGRVRRALRYWATAAALKVAVGCYVRLRVEGRDRLPGGPAVLCFNHQSWTDPFVLMAALPGRPRMYFFGPKEQDMAVGARNRLMSWVGTAVPYKPGKNDLLAATRRVGSVLAAGGTLAIAGEGRIHVGERALLPLSEGPAFFALRNGVPLVPVAVNGTGWLAFGRTVRVRIGRPIEPTGRPTHDRVEEMTAELACAIRDLTADFPDRRPPGPFGRWLTELFNEWPEGSRPETNA